MFKAKAFRKNLFSAALLVIMITSWVLFAPIQSGGDAVYVILSGNSMSPKYKLGDLVIVKEANVYQIGDAVTYQHPTIGYVFHRIIAINPDSTYQLQGDHNDWVDSYAPSQAEIVGKLWLHFPKLGKTLKNLRNPWSFAALTFIFILLLYLSVFPQKKRTKRNTMNSASNQNPGENIFILAAVLLGTLILGIAAFRQPTFNKVETPLSYEEQAFFRYSANVPSGIYDSTQVSPGEPIFRRLNGSFVVNMDYIFISPYANNISGSYRLLAQVSDGSGWKRTIELSPAGTFSGNVFTTSGTLELDNIQAFIDALETETGIQRGRYDLSIITEIKTEGTLDGISLTSSFSPAIAFTVSDLEVVLKGESADSLNPRQSGMLTRTDSITNTISIFGMKIPVRSARWIALGFGLPSLFLLAALLIKLYRSSEQDELTRLKLWYGSRLIETRDPSLLTRPNMLELANLEGLVNLAEQEQRTILYLSDGDQRHLFVQTAEQFYHYQMETQTEHSSLLLEKPNKKDFTLPAWLRSPQEKKLKTAYELALKGWAEAVDKRLSIEGQSNRVAEMAYQLAQELGVQGKELEDIRMAAYLHKIGMMDVPNTLIEKKEKLSQKELEILRSHPIYAHEHLKKIALLEPIAEAIYAQHERWDGTGQPEGLAGKEIPLGARIISVANIWSGLSQPRPYRDAWEQEEICQYFVKHAGKQFDPEIVEVFLTKVLHYDIKLCERALPEKVIDAKAE